MLEAAEPALVLVVALGVAAGACAASGGEGPSAQGAPSSAAPHESDPAASKPTAGELFQVILNVRDMERQVTFYRDVMGFRVLYPKDAEDLSTASFVRLDTGAGLIALHPGRTSAQDADEPRLSFMTEDLAGVRARLVAAGVRIGGIRNPAPGVYVADARDPEGNALHIEEHDRDPRSGD